MDHSRYNDNYIREILDEVKTVAIVGASANTSRPSYFVLKYLISKGYKVLAINPGQAGKDIAGAPCFATLAEADAGHSIDMVDIFRNSEAAFGVVEDALELDPLPKVIWMQLEVKNTEAAELAEARSIKVVMDRCPKIEYARLCGEIGWMGVNSGVISSKRPKLQNGFQRFGIKK